jgi:hypothetical protein
MMKRLFAVLLLFLLNPHLSASELPADKAAALDDIFKAMDIEQQLLGGFEAMLPMVNQLAAQLQLDEEEKEELKSIYRTWFVEDIDRSAILGQMRTLYAEAFTAEELEDLNAFYRSPTGQTFLKKSPELMKAGAQIGMAEAQKVQHKLLEKLGPFIEKHSPSPSPAQQ